MAGLSADIFLSIEGLSWFSSNLITGVTGEVR
jgi:hypothetical protein